MTVSPILSSRWNICLLFAILLAFSSSLRAEISEPDNRLWGNVVLNSAIVTAAETGIVVEARRTLASAPLASYRMGENPAAGNFYSLAIPLESVAPYSDLGAAKTGDTLLVLVHNGTFVRYLTTFEVGPRGTITRLDLGDVDADNNSLIDNWERQHLGGAGQDPNADPDRDGISNRNEMLGGTLPLLADARHPADANPTNNVITIHEVTAYALAWKLGQSWPIAPTNIPIDYLTRAGYLWKNGEYYHLDTNQIAAGPPLWWTNRAKPNMLMSFSIANEAEASAESAVKRILPVAFRPALPFEVTLEVNLQPGVSAYAIEETVPLDWPVTLVSDEGSYNPKSGVIRWGPFYDGLNRTLTYRTAAASMTADQATFSGTASFDGANQEIVGDTLLIRAGLARLAATAGPEGLKLSLRGEPGGLYQIQVSEDLRSWRTLLSLTADAAGNLTFKDPDASPGALFYRAQSERSGD